jgi:hypothetical protein
MRIRSRFCASDLRKLSAQGGEKVLIFFDECDHLAQQEHFQDALQLILKECPNISFLLSTHQPIYQGAVGADGQRKLESKFQAFKHIHVLLKRLNEEDSGKLFLRRLSRTIKWSEVGCFGEEAIALGGAVMNASGQRVIEEVTVTYRRVGLSPLVQACGGHPKKLIEAAMRL